MIDADLPMVVSGKHVAIIDPHRKSVKVSETSPAGTRKKLSEFFKHSGHVSTFESVFGFSTQAESYKGTIFRFPLRQSESNSEISSNAYTPEMIKEKLFESLKEETSYLLLFLKNVKSISLMEWAENSSAPSITFSVQKSESSSCTSVEKSTQASCETFARQCTETDSPEIYLQLKSIEVSIDGRENHHWLVMNTIGSQDSIKYGKELSILPWVGLATRLPRHIPLLDCAIKSSMKFDDSNTVKDIHKQLESQIEQANLSIVWSENTNVTDGHAFCFLPLPERTAMPVHIHGYFAVTDNRRSIKWPAHDEKGKEAQWNRELLYKIVAPSYALLLACRASLICYEDTPLPIANTNSITDAYSTWPLYSEVKNVPIWNELISPTVSFSSSLPLLWTPACGGKWVQFSEAYYLPGSFSNSSYHYTPIIFQVLINLDIPVVSLPRKVCETIRQDESTLKQTKDKEISPHIFRQIVKVHPHCCSSLSKKELYDVLEFVLLDLNESTYHDLINVPLLPLKRPTKTVTFEPPNSQNSKYIFPLKSKSLIEIIPGADNLIIDPELPKIITKKLCEIARTGILQLREVDTDIMCKQLLPVSIQSWCKKEDAIGWQWTPGEHSMPPQIWMDALWKWIGKASVMLSMLQELPVIPLCSYTDLQQDKVTLIEPKGGVKLCLISDLFTLKEKIIITSILKAFGFLIVDKLRMNKCYKMENHPDFNNHIPELCPSLELIVHHLCNLNISNRLQAVQMLQDNEKDFLRRQFSTLSTLDSNYKSCLRSIPIYHAINSKVSSPQFISLDGSDEAFLPPDNLPPLPDSPPNMLSPVLSYGERLFFKHLSVKQFSISDLCEQKLVPLILKHIKSLPSKWSLGDKLVLWILKQEQLPTSVLKSLSQLQIIYSCSSTHCKPHDLYDPQEQAFMILFDAETDKDRFPNKHYFEVANCRQPLLKMGMKCWKFFQEDCSQMSQLLHERMTAMTALNPLASLRRSTFILHTLAQKPNIINASLSRIPFLIAKSCPLSYPHCLKKKWFGQTNKFYCIEDMCLPHSNTANLIGTVRPILSHEYSHSVSVGMLDQLKFRKITEEDVLRHLTEQLQPSVVDIRDAENFHHIVMSVYEYLHDSSSRHKLDLIWCRETETPGFLPTNKFVLKLPTDLSVNLEPFYYCMRVPILIYEKLFQHHGSSLTHADVAGILDSIKSANKILTAQQVETCLSVLNWLCEKQYKADCILMLTENCTLMPVNECVFDDRNWMKDSKSKTKIKSKSLLFVHDRIPKKVAKHFQVVPLSCMVAPSQKLGISYIKAGQHEDITQRIRHIVQDYATNIDIFKELIQNADDAEATEVKFLIDWRRHPTESLIAEELKQWQGPALIAYNNATFSDEDFVNICKVAGETKKSNPLKTGRFGVGFCATYHLTDLPCFISRKYVSMFDPHTEYLGDRISSREPGMRVDLVENQADLGLYHDQFEPYNGLFGCNVFHLEGDGYPGTLFRFPFRSKNSTSRICRKIYNEQQIRELVQALKSQSCELLLFLKHIGRLSLYELDDDHDISAIREVFTVSRTGDLKQRLEMITKYSATDLKVAKTCVSKVTIDVMDVAEKHNSSQTMWMLSSAIGNIPTHMCDCPESQGLLPLAEVAVKITKSSELCTLPSSDTTGRKLFCFLPLPIKSEIPFHINGFFSIGKDRRHISATDDKTFGSMWNKSLSEDALVSAFIYLLQVLCKENRLQDIHDPELKKRYLTSYYSLWNVSRAPGLIGKSLTTSFKQIVPALKCSILWSEVNGGCWLPPTEIEIFMSDNKLTQDVVQDAIQLLLEHGRGIVDLPPNVYELLSKSIRQSGRVYDYKRFCNERFFPNIGKIDPKVRIRNITFLTEKYGSYDNTYVWANKFLKESPAIPCQNSNALRPACELIDPRNIHFKNLFDDNEGRFPCVELQNSEVAMSGLAKLGMATRRLSIVDLKSRAESVLALKYKHAANRSSRICAYIESTYCSYHYGSRPTSAEMQELLELSSIPFLSVKTKPSDVEIPWFGKINSFASPSQVFSPDHQHLVFSQHPIVNIASRSVVECLGIGLKKPTVDTIIAHLICLSQNVKTNPTEVTVIFLDEFMEQLLTLLDHDYSKQERKELMVKVKKPIWQDGYFLSPNQVCFHWCHSCVPYLCELSSNNKKFKPIIKEFGVKDEATFEMMQGALLRIATDYDQAPLPDKILHFVESVARQLESKLSDTSNANLQAIYLPDEQKIMRHVSTLAENVDEVMMELVTKLPLYDEFLSKGKAYFVHKDIPRQRAVKLGVKPLLEAVLKEIEDEDFMSGNDFGQREDLCDRLNGILKKYPADVSIFKEFIQNADDAQASEIVFVLDHRINFNDEALLNVSPEWKSLQHTPALCVFNNRKFTEADIKGITKLGKGGKDRSPELIGKFGIGFNVAYHVTDCPSFVSFGEEDKPEYLCVFDPTRSFVPSASNQLPGRKWNFKSNNHYSGFSDQFQPYLANDLPELAKCAPNCLREYGKHGYVVFRLPLTRSNMYNAQRQTWKSRLEFGHSFNSSAICNLLFDKLALSSKHMLLFLNHLRSVSSFEIRRDGTCVHHFTTSGSVPIQCLQDYERFSLSLKQYTEAVQKDITKRVSVTHQVSITHTETKRMCSIKEKSQWLVQRAVGGTGLHKELLQAGLHHGLRPIGGIAASLLKLPANTKFGLFCFLPLPISSNLPVHVNGHFLVDDSRKHLETIEHEGLGKWNETLAQKVIVSTYIDLIITAKHLLNVVECSWFYKLFPMPTDPNLSDRNIGELSNLNIVQSFYNELLQRNPSILIQEVSKSNSVHQWLQVKACLFCVEFISEKTNRKLSVNDDLRNALVSLGLPITTAPNYIYHACSQSDSAMTTSARIDPEKIINHLRILACGDEHKKVIKRCIEPLLQYCISDYHDGEITPLFNDALYLVAQDGSLQRGCLYLSMFSKLLPHCSHKFINPELEKSDVGSKLQKCNVICPLPPKFVSDNVALPMTTTSHVLSDDNITIITLLWKYLLHYSRTNIVSDSLLKKFFYSKAIIPTSDSRLYPVCLSSILIGCDCNNCSVMIKLGYPKVDFGALKLISTGDDILRNLIECFRKGAHIIQCFLLQEPRNFQFELSDDEFLSFSLSLGNESIRESDLRKVSSYLLRMPLFPTIDGSRISLDDITKVFILDSNDMPLVGIPNIHNGQVVLLNTSKATKRIYDIVIPKNISSLVSSEDLYLQHVLPILSGLKLEDIMQHVEHICNNSNKMTRAFGKLKETAFIEHTNQFYKPCELCDSDSAFFEVFNSEHVLPMTWQPKRSLLKDLGLQTEVTLTEWLETAKDLSKVKLTGQRARKSNILLNELITIVNNNRSSNTFLEEVADIEFIHFPQHMWALKKLLSEMFPAMKIQLLTKSKCIIKMKGSVSFHEANLACLCRPVLPRSCQKLISNKVHIRKSLGIEAPVTFETVVENLMLICKHVSGCKRTPDLDLDLSKQLAQIIEAHYACLSKMKLTPESVNELKDEACILLPSKSSLTQFVKPGQLVMQLPSECSLEPYCYRVEPSLQKYRDFLTAVGVRQELEAHDYITILASIKRVLDGNDCGKCDRETKVIKMLYREVIRCLRQNHPLDPDIVVFLPDEDMLLTDVNVLYLNDAQWYRCRLPPDCGCKIIHQPPVDDTGHHTLPGVLKIRKLSEIVTEELHEDCKSSDLICLDEQLFAVGKRTNDSRCVFIQNILSTLKSEELFHGFCRIYFTDYGQHPTKSYIQLVKQLRDVKVKCIDSDLKTVLHVDGKIIEGTVELDKFCHLCRERSAMILYIAPHHKGLRANMNPFFKDLALCINKMINNEIKNPMPIAAIFECEPAEIPEVLTREHIAEYSMDNSKLATAINLGAAVSWSKLSSQDFLIILNFDAGEPVYYLHEDGSIIHAVIVESHHTNQDTILQFLESTLTIRLSEPEDDDKANGDGNSPSNSDNDDLTTSSKGSASGSDTDASSEGSGSDIDMIVSDNSSDECDDDHCDGPTDINLKDVKTKRVSPIQIFKLLTVPQRKALWKGDITPFACPLVLPKIPYDDHAVLDQWLCDVYMSEVMQSHSGLALEVLQLRVMKNIVYQLRVESNEPLLLKILTLKIQDLAQKDFSSCLSKDNNQKDETINLLSDLMKNLTLDDVAENDERVVNNDCQRKLSKLIDEQKQCHRTQQSHPSTPSYAKSALIRSGGSSLKYHNPRQSVQPVSSTSQGTTPSKVQGVTSSQQWTTLSRSWGTLHSTSTFQGAYQTPRYRRNWLPSGTCQTPKISQPSTCMKSATAWLEQAKADFNAAGLLLGFLPSQDSSQHDESSHVSSMETSDDTDHKKCKFPALICFLCHDTVEKCIKGVHYAFCGLEQNLVNCSNLIMLHDALHSSPHCPKALMGSIKECVMTINRHENRSRFPNYQNPPCAPATTYDTEDAIEAVTATEKLLCQLQSEEKFHSVLQNLCQLPSQKFMSSLKSISVNQGE